jgi:hypothetical protein
MHLTITINRAALLSQQKEAIDNCRYASEANGVRSDAICQKSMKCGAANAFEFE